jgi:hypothetical protein
MVKMQHILNQLEIVLITALVINVGLTAAIREEPQEKQKPDSTFADSLTADLALTGKYFQAEDYECGNDVDIKIDRIDPTPDGDSRHVEGKFLILLDGRPVADCYGAKHTWLGKLTYNGYTFESDVDDPLVFTYVRNKGYVHLRGKGRVVMPDGKVILFR